MLTKSVKPERMVENLVACDFEPSQEEMDSIGKLDLGTSSFAGHDNVESARMRHGFKVRE